MLEILNILDMQKQKAEAELANLTRQTSQCLLEISSLNEGIANKQLGSANLQALEKWRKNQATKVEAINEKLKSLQREVQSSKQAYKKILAKYIAAKDMANRQQAAQDLHDEEQETSLALDTFLLISIP